MRSVAINYPPRHWISKCNFVLINNRLSMLFTLICESATTIQLSFYQLVPARVW